MCEGYSNPRSFHLSSPVLLSLFSCWRWPARANILFYRMLRLKSAMQPEKGGGQGKRFVMTELDWRGGWFLVLPQKSWDHSPTCHRLTTASHVTSLQAARSLRKGLSFTQCKHLPANQNPHSAWGLSSSSRKIKQHQTKVVNINMGH